MKAIQQLLREAFDNYARSYLRHFKEARLGEQRSSNQGEGIGHYCRAGGFEFVG
jgi:hypothetical protein